ncbi:MAG: hypothetical protein WBP13_02040 [Methylophilaceae bacterium]
MKQLVTKMMISSILLGFSGYASANNINFHNAAETILSAEQPLLEIERDNWYGIYPVTYSHFESYLFAERGQYYYLRNNSEYIRPVNLSELSNSDVSFSKGLK